MNGVDNILRRIIDEAKIAADELLEQAEFSAKDILEDYQSKGQFQRASILGIAKEQAAGEEKRMISLGNLEARKVQLQMRQTLLGEAYDKALQALHSLPKEQYVEVMCRLMLPYLKTGTETVTIWADGETEKLFQTMLSTKLSDEGKKLPKLAFEKKAEDGFLLKDGDIEMNCTFSALLKERWDELEQLAAKELF